MPGIFISATDTDVGKTVVSAGLAACLQLLFSQSVCVYKPLQTGSQFDEDMATLRSLTKSVTGPVQGIATHCDIMLPVPASPWVSDALAHHGQSAIAKDRLLETARRLEAQHELLLVEGAGGLMVPISPSYDMIDLARELQYPVLLVTRPDLGTVNHTRLSVEALLNRNIPVLGVVVSAMPDAAMLATRRYSKAIETLEAVFETLLPVPLLASLPVFDFASGGFTQADLAHFKPVAEAVLKQIRVC